MRHNKYEYREKLASFFENCSDNNGEMNKPCLIIMMRRKFDCGPNLLGAYKIFQFCRRSRVIVGRRTPSGFMYSLTKNSPYEKLAYAWRNQLDLKLTAEEVQQLVEKDDAIEMVVRSIT